ncbi:MAG TPA: hypothetical protein VGO49_15260 [Bradyrhizobium sp.]|jgi:hypothetical protein|nr:hypothetical protein [Bradyrhizobium sp.]
MIVNMQDKPEDDACRADEAELTSAFRKIFSAMERGDIEEVAIALGQVDDPRSRRPASYARPKKSDCLWGGLAGRVHGNTTGQGGRRNPAGTERRTADYAGVHAPAARSADPSADPPEGPLRAG